MSASLANPDIERRFPELHPPLDGVAALAEANRCLYCFDAPCTAACPTHIDVPRFIKKIASRNALGSAAAILEANILGASCARVCPVDVLCEGACVMHRYNEKPIEIARLQRYAMEHFYRAGARLPWMVAPPRGERVACVGSGPASLACAAELAKRGYRVTVYESRPLPGGLNTYGVAEYKLRARESVEEVELVRSLGVEFRFGVEVGRDVTFAELERDYGAIFLGLGLGAMERLGIPGEDLPGVIDALAFIADYKTRQTIPVGRRVVVIGGGNTAIDAANAARRLGAEEVRLVYRRGEPEMPAFSYEYEHSKLEGVMFQFLAQPVRVVAGAAGRVTAVECIRMELGAPDGSGRRRPHAVPGSNFYIECDMVVRAIGQSRVEGALRGVHGVRLESGLIAIDRATGRTSNPKYYAGGDCVNGGREVVDAVADGKRAACGIAGRLEAEHG